MPSPKRGHFFAMPTLECCRSFETAASPSLWQPNEFREVLTQAGQRDELPDELPDGLPGELPDEPPDGLPDELPDEPLGELPDEPLGELRDELPGEPRDELPGEPPDELPGIPTATGWGWPRWLSALLNAG
jgi:hypothetical protein